MGELVSKITKYNEARPQHTYSRIPNELIREALDRVSLTDMVAENVALIQVSKEQMKGLCPFHNEKTASFFVNEGKKFFRCFGCGKSGNTITYLMERDGFSFRQAAIRLLQLAGLDYYETSEWIQSEASLLRNSVEKTVLEKTEEDAFDIAETMFYISETCHSILLDNPTQFDKLENLYLTIDDNYRFKNYDRIKNISKNLVNTLREINHDS